MKKLLLGNQAIARGAYEAGVRVATAYPGTPSTEITESIAEFKDIYVEWSPNEKVACEVAIGASIAGARSMVCMKHVGLNVAADPIFTFSYTGVNGGFVLVVADDPGMHSSQNEQDSRYYAKAANIPMLEPSDSQEALDYIKLGFELSEKYDTPIMLRTTTRLSHSQTFVELGERNEVAIRPYVKDVAKYAMMPAMAKGRHKVVEARMDQLSIDSNSLTINKAIYKDNSCGIICSGVVSKYVEEAMPQASVLKLGMVHPLPIELIREFASKVDKLIVAEELEPVIEEGIMSAGIKCVGKQIFSKQGELSVAIIRNKLSGVAMPPAEDMTLPGRPPVMCAGCPHRGVFYVLSKLKLFVSADIGCYTLGASRPLNAVDTVVCMGASIGVAHGIDKALGREQSKRTVAVIGDSTFVHSGITGVVDAVYNQGNSTIIILDNSTTGMTGHQDNPATGRTIRGEITHQLDLEAVVRACGVTSVSIVDAYDIAAVEATVKRELDKDCVSVIIAKRPCILLMKGEKDKYYTTDDCKKCGACLKIGCPAILKGADGKVSIIKDMCNGCGLCKQMCKFNVINKY